MNPDGSWDRGWHLDIQCDDAHKTGIIKALVGDSAGNIYVGGGFVTPSGSRRNLARFNAKGELDTAWRVDADGGPVETLAIDDDGNLFVGGFFTQISGVQRPYLAKVRDGKVVGEWSRESPCQFRRWR
ncbi:MAG: delta-60 repeat domain-containing protein [Proteobacteria bacterium]|nr:delta-60 repeat domain-containing protein [Pseudomonadota bacterium]